VLNPVNSTIPCLLSLASVVILASCAATFNYSNPDGPRYTGCGDNSSVSWDPRTGETVPDSGVPFSAADSVQRSPAELRVASFNIKFAVQIDKAIERIRTDPHLRDADVLLLQEMDEVGVRKIAGASGHCWVYYPAVVRPQNRRPFGNAILSRYPIREDHKVLLPHLARFGKKMQRIATAATLDLNGVAVRVYSVHLATIVELGPEARRDQARAIVEDAAPFPGPVLVGGDLNQKGLGEIFVEAGYDWLSQDLGKTTKIASLDHFFLKGLKPAAGEAVGKVSDTLGASDHRPIWARLRLRQLDGTR